MVNYTVQFVLQLLKQKIVALLSIKFTIHKKCCFFTREPRELYIKN